MPRKSYKRRPDGRYRIKHDDIYFYSSVGGTVSEALEKIKKYESEKAQGLRREAEGLTVMEYAQKWLPIHRNNATMRAYNQYARMLEHFCTVLDNKRMRDVTKSDIISYYNGIAEKSKSYIDKAASLINAMFLDAVDDGIILKNPCRTAKRPEGTHGTHRPLEDWERQLVHEMANEHRFGVAAMLMLYGGLRRGEAMAFNIERDVDFENGRIYVREAISFSEGVRGKIKTPKTIAGMRSIPLFEPLRAVLEGKHGLAISQKDGSRMTLSSFDRAWESYKYQIEEKINGFSRRWANGREWHEFTVRTHDFRHSFCVMCVDAGVDVKTLIQWMGHSDATMVQKIYDHVTKQREEKAQQKIAEQVEKMLEKQGQGVKTGVILEFCSKNA